ncbi:MAG: septum formation protein Maf [Salinivirgaceae bacterium]|nr:MAG: septum formation protein Maf [Salinivirgaceae bacterium]
MIDKLNTKKYILGSKSPRRKSLLEELGLKFSIETHNTDESYPSNLRPYEVAEYIAEQKAKAFANPDKNTIIITADTIVSLGDEILGKPIDNKDGYKMLRKLSDESHHVTTGVCIRTIDSFHIFHSQTEVVFDVLTDEIINKYLEISKPYDKAGAYGIQEWFGMIAVKEIKGSFYNVMGLPIHKLYNELNKLIS